MSIRFKGARALASILLLGLAALHAGAQSFPSKPVRIIVGFAAGTGPDITARTLAQKLSELWGGIGVVVDNKPGAAGLIAATETLRAAPDGYTLMLGEIGQLAIAPHTYTRLPYDPQKDFIPVSHVTSSGFVLMVDPKQVPARNFREFVEWSQKRPGGLFFGTFGAGTPGHFGAYIFGDVTRIPVQAVHYRTPADALVGLSGGDVQGAFASVGLATAQIKGGRLIGLGNTGDSRASSLKDIPTMKEQGFDSLQLVAWSGVVAPAKTPLDIVDKISADIVKVLSVPETRARMEELGQRATGTTRQEFARVIAADSVLWGKAVAATGFKAD